MNDIIIYNDLEQGTEEWLRVRLGKFTASDAQAISVNGKGLETLVFKKVGEIVTGKIKESFSNGDMERGKELEELARNAYELETGIVVLRVGFLEKSKRVGCSPDGLIGEDGMQEIKCKDDANYARYKFERKIDPEHYWQMQFQMLVSGRKWVDYVVFNPNFPTTIIIERVERNEADIEKLRLGLENGIEQVEKVLAKI